MKSFCKYVMQYLLKFTCDFPSKFVDKIVKERYEGASYSSKAMFVNIVRKIFDKHFTVTLRCRREYCL